MNTITITIEPANEEAEGFFAAQFNNHERFIGVSADDALGYAVRELWQRGRFAAPCRLELKIKTE